MSTNKLWQLPVVGRLGVQHGLLVGWFLLVAALAVMLVPGPAGSANAPSSLADPQTVDFGGQNHCGIVVGIGALGGFGSGDASCVSVESGNDSQVNTRGFGNIGMQFQNSPVGAPISNVHVSNFLANNNSNNTIIGNQDLIINGNAGASAGLFGGAVAATPDAPVAPAVDPPVTALPVADPAPAPAQPAAVDLGGQNHCGIVAGSARAAAAPGVATRRAPASSRVATRR